MSSDVTENNTEYLTDMLNPVNEVSDEDLNNLCYWFNELLEASLFIQWEIHKIAEHQDSMQLKILSEGFDNIITQTHKEFLKIKKENQWDNNIGESLK